MARSNFGTSRLHLYLQTKSFGNWHGKKPGTARIESSELCTFDQLHEAKRMRKLRIIQSVLHNQYGGQNQSQLC